MNKELIINAFERLQKCNSVSEVDNILDYFKIEQRDRIDENKYPKIDFTITASEIETLEKSGVISQGRIILDDKMLENTLVKLLYALSWKNADLHKIHHIIKGIKNVEIDAKSTGLVFYNYGKFLSKKEPLIDQHVIRAFAIFKNKQDTKITEISYKQVHLIDEYKDWLNRNITENLKSDPNYLYHIDKLLFALGKAYKRHSL